MSFGEEKKETKVRRWLHGRTLPDDSCGAMLRGGWSWSLAEMVPVGVGPWKTVRVRGFKMCCRRHLHRRQAREDPVCGTRLPTRTR